VSNFILIFLCLALGVLLKKTGKLHEKSHQVLNAFVIYVSLPAMVLTQIPALLRNTEITASMLVPVSMAWILFLLSYLFFTWLGKRLKWNRAEYGALILTAGLGNTSFVGFPLLETLFDHSAIQVGVLVDQLGTFLVLSTLGLITASALSPSEGKTVHLPSIVKNVLTFPPFVSVVVAVLWYLTGTSDSLVVNSVLERLSATLIPLALVAVGFQLKINPAVLRRQGKPLMLGLGFKLILAPIFFYLLYSVVFQSRGYTTEITLLESAMAPMITASVVAEEFGFNAEISSLMVGVGIPLSLITVCLWHQVFALIH
jgi:predicted permease